MQILAQWADKTTQVSTNRKTDLHHLAEQIQSQILNHGSCHVVFVCTHNSRRSQIAEAVFREIVQYNGLSQITSHSAGAEATATYATTVKALTNKGFDIVKADDTTNPTYHHTTAQGQTYSMYSKTLQDHSLTSLAHLAAVMVCDHADQNCPIIPSAKVRISLPYQDPKYADGTTDEVSIYEVKIDEIGIELFYVAQLLALWKEQRLVPIQQDHYDQLAYIYQAGIDTGLATFETMVPSWEIWDESHLNHNRWAIWDQDKMIGWAALSKVSDRCVYGGVAELSVYVHPTYLGTGIGKRLLHALIDGSERHGIWTLQAGIMRANISSIGLHKTCGFREIGYRERIGNLAGEWKDNIILERRSNKVGQ